MLFGVGNWAKASGRESRVIWGWQLGKSNSKIEFLKVSAGGERRIERLKSRWTQCRFCYFVGNGFSNFVIKFNVVRTLATPHQ